LIKAQSTASGSPLRARGVSQTGEFCHRTGLVAIAPD
jgi:hypothetical protein